MKTKYIWLCLLFVAFTACSNDDDSVQVDPTPELSAGAANFANFVSIGNSLTAGFTDNALFRAGQANSFPNLLSQRFGLVGGSAFNQPLTSDNVGGLLLGGNPLPGFGPRLFFDGSGPASLPATPTTDIALNNPTGPFNNMGVPGLRSFQVAFNGLGNISGLGTNPPTANPYFVRMASSPNASVLEDALAQNPTFVSLWIGNNDVLGFATSGGDQTRDAITSQGVFDASVQSIFTAISNSGAQAVVANIPDVTAIAFFNTVPFAPLSPANPDFGPQIPILNSIFGMLNQVYTALQMPERSIVFATDAASPVVIEDEDLADISTTLATILGGDPNFAAFVGSLGLPTDPQTIGLVAGLLGQTYGQTRQANENDLLTLTSLPIIGTIDSDTMTFLTNAGLPPTLAAQFSAQGITLPLADRFVLIPSERQEIQTATANFNATLQTAATSAGFAFVDANTILSTGLSSGDFELTNALVTGGAFSLDGVHPTARGYALIANEFMRAIDATYGSNFEAAGQLYNIGDFPVIYPATLQ
ncbi:G-D-S-L family lipolytic protein [Flavobacteriaceae bacterium AU392]|nr:G-D-S-L family lipolytic protein [Flavobacteriaceae bacterium]RKM85148.1 G-D-S-L family lipolytic protein [Flavobacteriaceae bacterium AU392]